MEIDAPTSSSAQERRRTQRVPFDARVRVWTAEGSAHRAEGENISELGMLLCTSGDEVAASDRPLRITFHLPKVETPLQVEAEVVHTRRDGQLVSIGVHFLLVPSVIRRMLRTYVATGRGRIKDYDPYPVPLGL